MNRLILVFQGWLREMLTGSLLFLAAGHPEVLLVGQTAEGPIH